MKNNAHFICPECGAGMTYHTDAGILECKACGNKKGIGDAGEEKVDYDFAKDEENPALNDWGIAVKVLRCADCKGNIVSPAEDASAPCPFCCSDATELTDALPGIRPDSIIPFKINMDKAGILLAGWIRKRRLAPFSLKNEYMADRMKALFIPYWSFDANTKSIYNAQAVDYYNDTEKNIATSNGQTKTRERRVQKIRWRFVSGTFDKDFRDIMYNDSGCIDQKVIEKIEQYNLNELVPYNAKYIKEFAAERYKSGLKAVWNRARGYMRSLLKNEIHTVIKRGSDVVGKVQIGTRYTDIRYRHILLPVWLSSYRFKNKAYNFFINGQTGEVQGNSPKSALKIGLIILVSLAVLAALYFFVIRGAV